MLFSSSLEEAEVIGIHKPEPRDLPASYRPISLLSGQSIFERHECIVTRPDVVRPGSGLRPLPPVRERTLGDIPRPSSGVQLALFADAPALTSPPGTCPPRASVVFPFSVLRPPVLSEYLRLSFPGLWASGSLQAEFC
ncbi:hypothetical protein EVAR_38929_1 [Eumeta japonica]|uniref:Uncharacterized protein n=1 Tax=Eumeta variegata TaxID=151549 RepID=A0A4C1ZTD5_EUMVA|nr:hypothetical protein EVAR_38929_1 [Eumeta japonica]